jgi:hypothetical protein
MGATKRLQGRNGKFKKYLVVKSKRVDLHADERIIRALILMKHMRLWIGFGWLRTGTREALVNTTMPGIPSPAERLSASKEALWSKLVIMPT